MAKFLLIFIGIGNFIAAALPRAMGWGQGMETRPETGGIPPELPLGIFFAIIWNVIFLLDLVNAFTTLRRGTYMQNRLAPALVLAGSGTIIWMLGTQFVGSLWLDLILLFPVMAAAWTASYQLDKAGGYDGTNTRLVLCILTGLLSGWIGAAVTISITDAAREILGHHASDFVWPYLWLTFAVGALITYVFTRQFSRSLWYFAGFGWGVAGIAANTLIRLDMPLLGYASIAFGIIVLYARLTRGADGATA